jgi:DNA-directed RNA polymerase specialized sigma24 family protein
VLFAVLPGLKNVARRALVSVEEREDLWATLLACVWEQIRSYPVDRRPRRIAANLLLDTMRSTLAAVRRERVEDEPLPTSLSDEAPTDERGEDIDALLARAVAAGAISPQEAQLVLSTRFDGIPLAHLAASSGEPYNRVKIRRQRAERRLLVWLGYRPVPRRPQKRPLSSARVAGAGHRPGRRI